MSATTFQSLQKLMPQLKKSNQTLRGPNRSPLNVVGETTLKLTYKDKSSFHRVFVIHNLQKNLLGLPAIKALEIIRGINVITQSIPDQYPTLFSGLETFKGEYTKSYDRMPNHFTCLLPEMCLCHYVGRSSKRYSKWKNLVLSPMYTSQPNGVPVW